MITIVTIETAKRLKELGFPQNTVMCYCIGNSVEQESEWLAITADVPPNEYEQYACPTFDEILTTYPTRTPYLFILNFGSIGYYFPVGLQIFSQEEIKNNNYTDAAAKLWIQLKEKQLI